MGIVLRDFKQFDDIVNGECKDHIDTRYRIELVDDRITPEMIDYMNSTTSSSIFYNEIDFEKLKKQYLAEVSGIVDNFKNLSSRMKIFVYMEIMRLNAMYETIGETAAVITQNGLSVGILGKGVCMSQACFLRDLFILSGLKAIVQKVHFDDFNHAFVVVSMNDGEYVILDPTIYNGEVDNINSHDKRYGKFVDVENARLISLNVNREEIIQAREYALNYLINKFGLIQLSNKIGLNELENDDKIMRIIAFLEPIIVSSQNTSFKSVELNGKELELGKVLELLFTTNSIKYESIPRKKKNDNLLALNFMGKNVVLNPKQMYISGKNYLVYDENGEYKRVSDNIQLQLKIEAGIAKHKIELSKKVKRH